MMPSTFSNGSTTEAVVTSSTAIRGRPMLPRYINGKRSRLLGRSSACQWAMAPTVHRALRRVSAVDHAQLMPIVADA